MDDKLILLSHNIRPTMQEQFDYCTEALGERWDMNIHDDVMSKALRIAKQQGKTKIRSIDDNNIHILSTRRELDMEEGTKTLSEWLDEMMRDDDVKEVLMATPRPLEAATVVDWLRFFPTITIAKSGVSYRQGVDVDDVQRVRAAILRERTTEDGAEILKQEWPGGRPPLGTATNEGALVKSEDFGDVRSTLQQVRFDDISIARAADELGCARKTITNILEERAELYNLPKQ